MADEDNRAFQTVTQAAVCVQLAGQSLGVVVNAVPRSSVREGCDIGVVAVSQQAHAQAGEELGQDVDWPEGVASLACPCLLGVAVEAVDENNTVNLG